MKETTYIALLEQEIQVRISFVRERSQILAFVVQLEYFYQNKWYPVVRYDTAHQFAHCDILYPDGRQEKHPLDVNNYNEALTYAQNDILKNYQRYCTRFKDWLNESRSY